VNYRLYFLFLFFLGWSSYFSFISIYLIHKYHYSALFISLFLADLGVGFSIGCGVLVDYCTKRFSFKKSVLAGLIFAMLAIIITLLFQEQWVVWAMGLAVGTGIAVAYSVMLAIFSNQVSDSEQGWIMGVTGAIMALCFGVTTFFMGFIAIFGVTLPLVIAAGGLGVAALLLFYLYKENNHSH